MRITCPNCQAQYDVDPSMIPVAGRDVQCSACAHTWFQTRDGFTGPAEAEELLPEEIEAEGGAPEDAVEEVADRDDAGPEDEDDDLESEEREPEAALAGAGDELGPVEEEEEETGASALAGEEAHWEEKSPADFAEEEDASGAGREPAPWEDDAPAASDEEEPASKEDAPAAAAEIDDDGGEDDGDRFRAAIDRPREDRTEPEPRDDEAFRDLVRRTVSDRAAEEAPEFATPRADEDTDGADAADGAEGPALDRDVAEILREEAEFEVTRRRGGDTPPPLEAQGDLALSEGQPSRVIRERLDRMRGDGAADAAVALGAAYGEGPRRDRLPDIEEINSSLRPGEGAEADEPPLSPLEIAATRRAGFRTGFAAVIAVVAILIGAYVFAPRIIGAVPAVEPAMIAYVEAANSLRDWIDGLMARAISEIEQANGA